MRYIVHKRIRATGLSGAMNLPFGTVCESDGCQIMFKGKPLVFVNSELGHQYFSRDDDGNGVERGALTQAIQKATRRPSRNASKTAWEEYNRRWETIWGDPALLKFKRPEDPDFWYWGDGLFNADIEELRALAQKLGIKGGHHVSSN